MGLTVPQGYATISLPPPVLDRDSDLVFVATYSAGQGGDSGSWSIVPNLRVVDVSWFEGVRPPVARIRYSSGNPLVDQGYPVRFEQVLPLASFGTVYGYPTIQNDTRIGIFRIAPGSNQPEILFDGFTQSPDVAVNSETESIVISAFGTPIREWDLPLSGAVMRDASQPNTANTDTATHLPTRFNPDGKPNATDTVDSKITVGNTQYSYPVFLGPVWPDNQINGSNIRMWTLEMAARYIIAIGNPTQQYTAYSFQAMSNALAALVPTQSGGNIDFSDPSTYTFSPIEVEDLDVTGQAWPEALERLVKPHGFGLCWRLWMDGNLNPNWYLDIYRLDSPTPVKNMGLQDPGNTPDPSQSNVAQFHISRDSHAIANTFYVDSEIIRIEADFILTPGFSVAASDANSTDQFLASADGFDSVRDKYRLFVLDEAVEERWDFGSASLLTSPGTGLDRYWKKLLGTTLAQGGKPDSGGKPNPPPRSPVMVCRRRKPITTLHSLDPNTNQPLHAELWVSYDYGRSAPGTWTKDGNGHADKVPGFWDGTGTWDRVNAGHWHVLHDRVGIRITAEDPEQFHAGDVDKTDFATYQGAWANANTGWAQSPLQANGNIIPLVTQIANPQPSPLQPQVAWDVPIFRLTCVVECDVTLNTKAQSLSPSPTSYVINRRVNARQRYVRHIISKYSHLNANSGPNGQDVLAVDDQDETTAMANAMVRANHAATFAGSVTIPYLTTIYRVGDHISGIVGRNVPFASNIGMGGGVSPIYPSVVSVTWDNDQRQSTTLQLSDRRAEWPTEHRGQLRPHFQHDAPRKQTRKMGRRH